MSIIRQQHYYFLSLNIEYTQCEMYALHFIARGTKKKQFGTCFFSRIQTIFSIHFMSK